MITKKRIYLITLYNCLSSQDRVSKLSKQNDKNKKKHQKKINSFGAIYRCFGNKVKMPCFGRFPALQVAYFVERKVEEENKFGASFIR